MNSILLPPKGGPDNRIVLQKNAMVNHVKCYWCILLFVFFAFPIQAQDFNFKHFAARDGLSSNVVYSMAQDSSKLIWFATRVGVDRYDGKNFTNYLLEDPEDARYSAGNVNVVLADRQNRIWAGANSGLYLYDARQDRFLPSMNTLTNKAELKVYDLYAASNNELWVASQAVLYCYNHVTATLDSIPIPEASVRSIYEFSQDTLVLSTSTGIYKVSMPDRKLSEFSSDSSVNQRLRNGHFFTSFKDEKNRMWFCSLSQGLFILDLQSQTFIENTDLQRQVSKGLTISDVVKLPDGRYIVGSDGWGLFLTDTTYRVLNAYRKVANDPKTLPTNGVYDVLVDNDKRVWVATYGGGAHVYDPNLLPFETITHVLNKYHSLGGKDGRTAVEDSNGKRWYGTNRGISIHDPKTGKWSHIFNTFNEKPLGRNAILSLCQVNNNEIWAASFGGGIDVININTFAVRPLLPKEKLKEAVGSFFTYKLLRDQHGDIWIGSVRGKLARYNLASKQFKTFPANNIHNIYEAPSGNLYFGSKEGFYYLNSGSEVLKHVAKTTYDLSSSACLAFYEMNNQYLYIGTEGGGMNVYDFDSGTNQVFLQKDGLPSNTISEILPAGNNKLWISTANGLSLYDIATRTFTNFDTSDGVGIKEFVFGASTVCADGSFIFGGRNGFVRFNPEDIEKIRIQPSLFLKEFRIANEKLKYNDVNNPLSKHINETDFIELDYDQNSFSFDFIGVNYSNESKNLYSWQLDGFEDDWQPATRALSVSYTNIPPGNYTFRLRASNVQNEWNGQERSINILVNKPFWKTGWAYTVYLIILATLFYFVVLFGRIQMNNKQSREKIQFFVNVAHDLRTPLTLIKSPLTSLENKGGISDEDKHLLHTAQNNVDRLTQHFAQLLDFHKAGLHKMQLQVFSYKLVDHLTKVVASFRPLIEKKNLKVEVLADNAELALWYDKAKLDKVFNNLLSNAIKYSKPEGKISIHINEGLKYVQLEFADNGIGIPEKQQKNILKHYYRATNAINSAEIGSGVGLLLVKQIVDLHQGKISFKSAEGEGTSFHLQFRKGNGHYAKSAIIEEESATNDLPVSIPAASPDMEQNTTAEHSTTKDETRATLLIVEDSPDLLSFLCNEFQKEYNVMQAQNGAIALENIKEKEPDLIVSDLMMPEMDGNTLCSTLKQNVETSHIPFILLTALSDTDVKINSYEIGADSFVEKPFNLNVLKSQVKSLLNSRARLKKLFSDSSASQERLEYQNELDKEFIDKIMDIVNKRLDDSEFSVEIMCKELYMSRPVVYRKLKALTGNSPQDFIKIIRLRKAAEYLRQGRHTISEVAYQCGFSDPKYFSTAFKKFFGVSPSKFE